MSTKRKVILVTDGDSCAQRSVEVAAKNIGGRCISRSGGNPTPLTGSELIKLIKEAHHDPVVVMVDDVGNVNIGESEKLIPRIMNHPDIELLGILAVASNTEGVNGVHVDFSIDSDCKIVDQAVDKNGYSTSDKVLYGDTVDIIDQIHPSSVVVGIGDVGKMDGKDDCRRGAPVITRALEEILKRSGYH